MDTLGQSAGRARAQPIKNGHAQIFEVYEVLPVRQRAVQHHEAADRVLHDGDGSGGKAGNAQGRRGRTQEAPQKIAPLKVT